MQFRSNEITGATTASSVSNSELDISSVVHNTFACPRIPVPFQFGVGFCPTKFNYRWQSAKDTCQTADWNVGISQFVSGYDTRFSVVAKSDPIDLMEKSTPILAIIKSQKHDCAIDLDIESTILERHIFMFPGVLDRQTIDGVEPLLNKVELLVVERGKHSSEGSKQKQTERYQCRTNQEMFDMKSNDCPRLE